ncbi:MAG: 50S ribosomal protein L30 [Chloroflexi bacterium]|nr:50S ribosomal protein L30 [Chloroflexota bacterium]
MAKLRITWTRSAIGFPYPQRRVIRALGLRRLHQTVEREDTPSIRGMVHKVKHMVVVEKVGEAGA